MRQVRLGQTDLQVSTIAFGTWAFGGDWGTADRQDSKDAIHRALELGINFFDTAQGYRFGASEQLLAEALRERIRRDEVVIATKGGLRLDGDRVVRDDSRRWPAAGAEPFRTGGDVATAVPPVPPGHRVDRPALHLRA